VTAPSLSVVCVGHIRFMLVPFILVIDSAIPVGRVGSGSCYLSTDIITFFFVIVNFLEFDQTLIFIFMDRGNILWEMLYFNRPLF
jgi:hypothetical protein